MIDTLQKLEWWSLEDDVLKENMGLFQNPVDVDNLNKLLTLSGK